MQSQVISDSFTINHSDALYLAQQISIDLTALSQAYPEVLSPGEAMSLFMSYSTFLVNYAVTTLGFSIYDPSNVNLVYHEYRYEVLYEGNVQKLNSVRHPIGRGGKPVNKVWLPASAKFTPWVVWSPRMLRLSIPEQERIVSGTRWDIPSQGSTFIRRFEGNNWNSLGFYGSGNPGGSGNEYRRDH